MTKRDPYADLDRKERDYTRPQPKDGGDPTDVPKYEADPREYPPITPTRPSPDVVPPDPDKTRAVGAVLLAELQNAGSALEAFEVSEALAREVRGLPDNRPYEAGFAAGMIFRVKFPQYRVEPDFPEAEN